MTHSPRVKRGPKPRPPATPHAQVEETDAFAQSIRFDKGQGAFLRGRAVHTKTSVAELVRSYVDDVRTFFDLPRPQLERHLTDLKLLGLTPREYIRYLLSLRYEAMVLGNVELSAPPDGVER